MLINIATQIRKMDLKCHWDYYNGGWLKTVTGIDKTQSKGYSIEGSFLDNKNGLNDIEKGLFLGCSIEGSRKHQEKCYLLFEVDVNGEVQIIQYTERNDWYLFLRPHIDKFLETEHNPLEQFTDDELLQELHRRGLKLNDLRHITYSHEIYEKPNRDPMIIDEEEKHAN